MKRQRIVIAVRIDERDRSELSRLARSNGLSESAIARLAIKKFIPHPEMFTLVNKSPENESIER